MTDILLVHGACHGAWCWRDLVPQLQGRGHRVTALDLPAHGTDPTPRAEATLAAYVGAILAAARAGSPPLLVGHSMGGLWISAAGEAAPGAFAGLVYLTAFAPVAGRSLHDLRRASVTGSLKAAIDFTADGLATEFSEPALEPLFYHDCPAGTTAYARQHLCPEPIRPTQEPLALTDRYHSLPRDYVRCLADRVIAPEAQAVMSRDWPAERVHEMTCGHSPFFADPDGLAQVLNRIAQ
ncbi:alpha/beta fold hydrolase [Frigidibacter sp. ROC022]|uniref:alpha/beta fold hydrolase n=1 Tax=Frigidibacter sp. ROC022 TaxID=2971796 RepID=UPI00215A5C58|nr:alpha/beta fold hydrolase [Frigidibacter sp. ROC022]MCR8722796.1 alpha/beta fold hydrolase [Frigidibacter sp. ROC022]